MSDSILTCTAQAPGSGAFASTVLSTVDLRVNTDFPYAGALLEANLIARIRVTTSFVIGASTPALQLAVIGGMDSTITTKPMTLAIVPAPIQAFGVLAYPAFTAAQLTAGTEVEVRLGKLTGIQNSVTGGAMTTLREIRYLGCTIFGLNYSIPAYCSAGAIQCDFYVDTTFADRSDRLVSSRMQVK